MEVEPPAAEQHMEKLWCASELSLMVTAEAHFLIGLAWHRLLVIG